MKKVLLFVFLAIISLSLSAQYSRDQAINIAIEIVGADSLIDHPLFSRYEKINAGDTLWLESYDGYLFSPFESAWVFFVNDLPIAYWAHPCRYIFVDVTNGDVDVKVHDWPPHPVITDWQGFLVDWQWIFTIVSDGPDNKLLNETSIILYPNPTEDHIYIDDLNLLEGNVEIQIFNSHGVLIQHQTFLDSNGKIKLDISNIKEGLYLLTISQNKKTIKTEKFIKF